MIGGLLGSIARRFVPLLKLFVKAAGQRLLRARTSFVSDVIDGKPVGDAACASLKKCTEIRNNKCRCDEQPIIPKKRQQRKQDIFS